MNGYQKEMRSAGLAPRKFVRRPEQGAFIEAAAELLSSPERPTAVVAYCHRTAFPLLYAAIRLGMDVPRELSLITFEKNPDTISGAHITNLLHLCREFGLAAAKMLKARIGDPGYRPRSVAVPFREFAGHTCVRP